jgi:hypothetical protein
MAIASSLKAIRCAACQLQLCKSRDEPPHSKLTETTQVNMRDGRSGAYLCQTCGVTMIRSADLAKPGWSSQRP